MRVKRRGPLPASHFVILSYDWVRDYRLSPYTVGVMARLLSNTSRFLIDVRQLAQQWRQPVRAIRRALSELVKFGYAAYEQQRADDGTLAQVTMSIGDPAALHTVQPGADQGERDESAGHTALHTVQPGSISLEEQLTEDQVLDAADASPHLDVISGGNQMNEPTLFDVNRSSTNLSVITGHPGTDITETDRPTNAGHLVAAFIDFCKAHGVTLTGNLIGRYGKLCKRLIGDDIPVDVLKQALAQMLADRVLQWPNRLEQYVMEAQTGPELRRAPLAQTFKDRQEQELMAWAVEKDRLAELNARRLGA